MTKPNTETEVETPRTDAAWEHAQSDDGNALKKVSQKFERENAELRARQMSLAGEIEDLRSELADTLSEGDTLRAQLAQAKEKAAEQGRHAVTLFDECKRVQRELAQAQNEALERAAKVCEQRKIENWVTDQVRQECADAIRALKKSPNSAEGELG